MKKFTKILILAVALITMIGGFAPRVFAAPVPLSVSFVPDPLFVKPNFLPEDETSGTVTVTNNSGTTQNIGTEAINVLDNDNFGSLLRLKIMEGSATLYDNTLAHFFTTNGEFPLGAITNGTSRTFTYTISFINSSDNSYQGKTLGFDVCVGFLGGPIHCGETPINNGGNITGGGGSSGSTQSLIIFNEQALNISNVGGIGSSTIIWNTNLSATSQVVYGPASGGPYTLNLTPPNFGYPLATAEDSTKVINHSMSLTNLTPGVTYLYRVISHDLSAPTISAEHQFTVPVGLVLGASTENSTGPNNNGRQGDVLGASTENTGSETSPGNTFGNDGEVEGASNSNLATALASGFGNILSTCNLIALLILVLIYLIWKLWLRKRYEKALIREEEIRTRFYVFFGGATLLAILVCIYFYIYCPIPIFVLVFIISICVYIYRKLRVR